MTGNMGGNHSRCGVGCLAIVVWLLASVARADVVVPGTSDPYLAGMPAGSTASFTDTAPAQSPVLAANVTGGQALTFSVTGSVNFTPNPPTDPPDGDLALFTQHATGAENGLSNINAPTDSLVGVFLTDNAPNLSSAPSPLDFSAAGLGINFKTLSPSLQQVFFIGDGRTSANQVQTFIAPTGATRLYLGTMDGFGWGNNSGSFDVVVAAPLPSTASGALALVCAMVVIRLYRKLKTRACHG